MAYSGIGTNGNIGPCVVFYQRLNQCIRAENLPNKMCQIEGIDYLECVNRRKQNAINYQIEQELHKGRILELPSYDTVSDKFVSRFSSDAVFQH